MSIFHGAVLLWIIQILQNLNSGLFLEEITVYQEYQTDNRYLDSDVSQSHEQSRTRATFAIGELREFTKYIQFELRLDGSMGI
jgi:hypothetical protein